MNRPPSSGRFAPVEQRSLRPNTIPNGNPDLPPSSVGEDVDEPGDPEGFSVLSDSDPQTFGMTVISPSAWSGWPADWLTPLWGSGGGGRYGQLVDTAWAAIDLNASILSTMPPYRVRERWGQPLEMLPPKSWMINPDPDLYTSWEEFAKQYAWSFQTGEVFVLPTAYGADGYPARFHVVEPWLVNVEMSRGMRRYNIGSIDVTDEILHVRYQSSTDSARGTGPLDAGSSRVLAAGVLAHYATNLARTGGVPHVVLKHQRKLTAQQADELLHNWFDARMQHLGMPAVASGGLELETLPQASPRDMALLELAQFNESRIAVLLGVPPFLLGLPSGGDSMTYSNVSALFDYHWRAGLRPKADHLFAALSQWALPAGQRIEVNRDEYVRPGFTERIQGWSQLHAIEDETGRAVTAAEVRDGERLNSAQSTAILTGG